MTDQNNAPADAKGFEQVAIDGETPSERLAGTARWVVIIGTLLSLVLVINQLFNLQLMGIVLIEGRYLYVLGGMYLALSFLIFQMRGGKGGVPSLLDWALFAIALACTVYLAQTAQLNLSQGWEYAAPLTGQYVSVVFFVLVLEATRRAGGFVLFCIVTFFAFYPTFAGHVPDPFSGFESTFMQTVPYHIFSAESSFGIPMKAFGGVVIGFILFGAVLQRTGGGQFFNDLALGLVGGYRGGAAKVSIFHGLNVRFSYLERVDHGRCINTGNAQNRLLSQDCRRDRGMRFDRWRADAAHYGGHGIYHGLVPVAPICRDCLGRRHPQHPVLLGAVYGH